MPADPLDADRARIISATGAQIEELSASPDLTAETALARVELDTLKHIRTALPVDAQLDTAQTNVDTALSAIPSAKNSVEALGAVFVALHNLQRLADGTTSGWIADASATRNQVSKYIDCISSMIARFRRLLGKRPDVDTIMGNLEAIKNLRGGPADAEAFHDFHVLQIAFKHVWLHCFDASLQAAAEQLYHQLIDADADADVVFAPTSANGDLSTLSEVVSALKPRLTPKFISPPQNLGVIFGENANQIWTELSFEQQGIVVNALALLTAGGTAQAEAAAKTQIATILAAPEGSFGRLSRALLTLDRALNEKYAFDIFATDSYNYGLLTTYRQHWTPGMYQAGNLVATIPLAPGETRKFSKKHVVKKSRAQKEIEKVMSSRSDQSSVTARAETEIMHKVDTATNFKMTTSGSFNVGIGSFSASSEFGGSQSDQSASNKKDFREATKKATEEYRREHSLEVDSSEAEEWEEVTSGEISNPNNEITVTYLFYELQRRYKIRETLHRVRPVIMIAQDVPAPHEINEGWLIQHHWILARVILDDLFKPALGYLASGFAGDEVAIEVSRARWEKQRDLVTKLEALTQSQLENRGALRELIIKETVDKDNLDNANDGLSLLKTMTDSLSKGDFTFSNVINNEVSAESIEANRRAAETRLKYVEEALSDAQEKLRSAASAFESATTDYTNALKNKFSRGIAIDQLRVHVKQNILYYMQAIWEHEPPDQRFFRLYNKKVICPKPMPSCQVTVRLRPTGLTKAGLKRVQMDALCAPSGGAGGDMHELVEVADLDNPLGYKGNYILFPLKHSCYLTDYMLSSFIDEYMELRDPDGSDDFDPVEFEQLWQDSANDPVAREALKVSLAAYLTEARRASEEIIVPTGQLFIEALPGTHPLLEDFKLLHRFEDVRKVRAEVRHAELENLRLASRLVNAYHDPSLLEDPDIEKKIIVQGSANLSLNTDS